jgi:hypothetical protein
VAIRREREKDELFLKKNYPKKGDREPRGVKVKPKQNNKQKQLTINFI